MKKGVFLKSIQQSACFAGSPAAIAWTAAVETDDKDPRWARVETHPAQELQIQNFANVFGVDIPTPVVRKMMTPEEALEKKIAKAQENHTLLVGTALEAQSLQSIQRLKKELARIFALELDR